MVKSEIENIMKAGLERLTMEVQVFTVEMILMVIYKVCIHQIISFYLR
jgi:hypothetical protein